MERIDRIVGRRLARVCPTFERKDSMSGTGIVEIMPFDLVDGQKMYITEKFTKHNLIVELGRGAFIDYLEGTKPIKKLKFIRWGKGGALAFPAGDPLVPLPVGDTDQNVTTFLLDKALHAPTRNSVTSLTYLETLISDEVNSDVNEAAMMFEDQTTFDRTIFARITFPTARLTNDRGNGIDLRWTFNFTKAV